MTPAPRSKNRPAPAAAAAALLALSLTAGAAGVAARGAAVRLPADDVKGAAVRTAPGLAPGDHLLFNGWGVTPAGDHTALPGNLPLKMVPTPDGRFFVATMAGYNDHGLVLLDAATGKVARSVPMERAWNGLAFSKDGKRLFAGGGNSGRVHVLAYDGGRLTEEKSFMPAGEPDKPAAGPGGGRRRRRQRRAAAAASGLPDFVAGMAVHPATGKLYVCNEGAHEVWVVNPDTLETEDAIPVGQHPHSCAVGKEGRYLYVSQWGGRSVGVIDLESGERVRDVAVGVRPSDMALGPDGRLFVACAGDNTVHVIPTATLERAAPEADPNRRPSENAREIIDTSLYPAAPEGSTPCSVAVSPDGKTLYVANADNNDVAVVDVAAVGQARVAGFVPTGWYPSAVAASPDSGRLFVASGKGLRGRPSFPASEPRPRKLHKGPAFNHPGQLFTGYVSVLPRPDAPRLAEYTAQVRRNCPYTPGMLRQAPPPPGKNNPIPSRVGDPSPIKHVLYIIKENRTYDQVFGDLKGTDGKKLGNGDPALCIYGEDVTPNHHELARRFVVLDNLYCNGEVSRDGHSWSHGAMATDYKQRAWAMSYSGHGDLPGDAELNDPRDGYLWDQCRRQGVSFKSYGPGRPKLPIANRGTWGGGRDMNKVEGWIADLKAAEEGKAPLPSFMIMSLGEDHTRGTTPGAFTPEACVGSNDVGLARIVEAASKSKFWEKMAIFVIEDDAQNGPDHVDSHRTVGLVISPWVKRGSVDSTMYSTVSMIRTMELILGLPPLTQYDAGATPMYNCFADRPTLAAYAPLKPRVDLTARNAPNAPGAAESARMDWREYDRIPDDRLNRILWAAAKGPGAPYPAPRRRATF